MDKRCENDAFSRSRAHGTNNENDDEKRQQAERALCTR